MRWLLAASVLFIGCAGPVNPGGAGRSVPTAPGCSAEVDGMLSVDELAVATGVDATYVRNAIGATESFEPEPHMDASGVRVWDLSDGPTDVRATLALEDASGWPAEAVPDAMFAIPTSLQWPDLLSLLDVVDAGGTRELRALGLATRTAEPLAEQVRLVYDAPVTMLRAPIEVGDSWGGQATFRDARLAGIPNAGVEDWTFEVVDIAEAILPGGVRIDDVLAIRVTTTRTLAVAAGLEANQQTMHMLQLFAPCVGELARAVGPDASLTNVEELRRLEP